MSDFASSVSAGGVTVTAAGEDLLTARDATLGQAIAGGIPAGVVAKEAGLWGPDAADEAARRLGWLDVVTVSRELVPRIDALREALQSEGVDHVVLAGMGGSSLAPEVITKTYDVELTVLDTTDPEQVKAVLGDRLDRTAVVVSSKSGGTLETDSHHRAFRAAFDAAGIDPAQRIVVVTDPRSPLEQLARDAGVREVFLADPNVGGRYSALTAFGLVPSGLAGVPVGELLDQAEAIAPSLSRTEDNPGLWLGAAIGGYAVDGHDKLVIAETSAATAPGEHRPRGFGDWAEQLIAESTGKSGRGVLPVVVDGTDSPGFAQRSDTHLVTVEPAADAGAGTSGSAVSGPLGGQFLVWEFATAVAGWALKIDPFNQPNVQESKDNTNRVLADAGGGPLPTTPPVAVDGVVEIRTDGGIGKPQSLRDAIDALVAAIPDSGYLAVMAYLDRTAQTPIAGVRDLLAQRTDRQVTFGWGPRFLHSTGQYHKGGPQVGAFLQVTAEASTDVPIPDRDFGFATLQLAQATGDAQALSSRGRPLLRLHLTDRAAGVGQLLAAVLPGQARP